MQDVYSRKTQTCLPNLKKKLLKTFSSPPNAKQRWKLYFSWLHIFPYGPVSMERDWHWWKGNICKFESQCLNMFFNDCVVFASTSPLIIVVHLFILLIGICFKASMFNSYQEQLERNTKLCTLWHLEKNVWLLVVCKAHTVHLLPVNEEK
jgi:hypothetical protein